MGTEIMAWVTVALDMLPAGRDLLFDSPCKVKRFLALAADWLIEVSAEQKKQEGGVSSAVTGEEEGHGGEEK